MIFCFFRFIVFRRLFLILGLLYGYRAITMFVTVFPKANPSYHCDPKLSEKGQNLTVAIVLHRAVKILSGFGLSMNGQHVFCGDYLYSGHTMTFVLAYLIIMECKFFFRVFQNSPMKGFYIGMKIVKKYSSK